MLEKMSGFGGKLKIGISKHSVLISMLYSFSAFLIVYIFAYPEWENSDDFMISGILAGLTGEGSPYTLVLSYPMSYILLFLQSLIPQLNWLTFLEIFGVWLSFTVLIWILLKKDNPYAYIVTFIFPIIFELSFYTSITYSRSASLLAFSGLFLIYYCYFEKRNKRGVVLGIAMFVLASLIRFACIYLAVPYVGIFVLLYWWRERKKFKIILKKDFRFWFVMLGMVCLILTLREYHNYQYARFQKESEYVEYNSARAKAYDYLPSDYETYRSEFEELDFSCNDYELLKQFMFYDEYYNVDLYEEIIDINFQENDSLTEKWNNFINRLWKNLVYYSQAKRTGEYNIFWLFIVVALIALIFIGKESVFSFVCAFLGTFAIAFYFIWTGRFPPWLQDSVYLMGAFSMLYGMDFNVRKSIGRFNKFQMVLATICLICGLGFSGKNFIAETHREIDLSLCQALNYMENDNDNVYLIDNFSNCPYPIMDAYGTLRGLEPGSWSNIIRVGSWFIKHPSLEQQLKDCGLESPISEMVLDDVYLFTNINSENIVRYQIFFEEHHHLNICPELIQQWGNYALYSFNVVQK